MFSIKKIIQRSEAGEKDKATSDRIGIAIQKAQRKVADYLNHKTATWSPKRIKITLILFCLVTGNICLYTIGRAILSANGPPKSFKVQRLPKASLTQPGVKSLSPADTQLKTIDH